MTEQKVKIIAECVCDLPSDRLKTHNVDIVYFTIETDRGVFFDTSEITSDNVISYIQADGKKAHSSAPEPDVYKEVFEKNLAEYDEVILVAISSGISLSCENADKALSRTKSIEKNMAFITQAGCNTKMIEWIKNEVSRNCDFENLVVTKASATVSCNCGPNTFGVFFIEK